MVHPRQIMSERNAVLPKILFVLLLFLAFSVVAIAIAVTELEAHAKASGHIPIRPLPRFDELYNIYDIVTPGF